MALQTKKNGLDVDLISQTIYLPIGTNNQQSFSSLLRSHHMRILLQHSFRTKQHSVKDWSDKLPDQQIRQTSLWSCFRQQFHLHHRIVMRHKSNGIKISHVEHHKHHGRIVAGTSLLMKRGQTTSMSKIFKLYYDDISTYDWQGLAFSSSNE